MKDLGAAKQILSMRFTRNNMVLRLSQKEYVNKVLSRFSMSEVVKRTVTYYGGGVRPHG